MRLVRIEAAGRPRYGALSETGTEVALLQDFPEPGTEIVGDEDVLHFDAARLLAPVRPGKVIAIGSNYAAHAREMGLQFGTPAPSVFLKPPQTVVGPGATVLLPTESQHVEHEAEIAVVIGRAARRIAPNQVPAYVLGLTCANDISARDLQRSDPQLTRGKGFDTFCPLGPWITTGLDLVAPRAVRCSVNGELRQDGTSADMIQDIPGIVSWVSSWTTLEPGDVLLTGSPAGTTPLHDGDVVEIAIEGVGTLVHWCADEPR